MQGKAVTMKHDQVSNMQLEEDISTKISRNDVVQESQELMLERETPELSMIDKNEPKP